MLNLKNIYKVGFFLTLANEPDLSRKAKIFEKQPENGQLY